MKKRLDNEGGGTSAGFKAAHNLDPCWGGGNAADNRVKTGLS